MLIVTRIIQIFLMGITGILYYLTIKQHIRETKKDE